MKLLDSKVFNRRTVKGEIGLEIECEGRNIYMNNIAPYWAVHGDGSLRGESAEYVLKSPIEHNKVPEALEQLFAKLRDYGTVLNQSHRTSVHVHVNVQSLTWRQLLNFIALYTIFEKPLLEYCGEDRLGNLFCLPVFEAEAFNLAIQDFLNNDYLHVRGKDALREAFRDDLRYCSVNLCALAKFGSLEFRSLRGDATPEEIARWVDLIYSMYCAAQQFDSPVHMIQEFSINGPRAFNEQVFADTYLFDRTDDCERKLYEGVRVLQDWCFEINWEPRNVGHDQEEQGDEDDEPQRPFR